MVSHSYNFTIYYAVCTISYRSITFLMFYSVRWTDKISRKKWNFASNNPIICEYLEAYCAWLTRFPMSVRYYVWQHRNNIIFQRYLLLLSTIITWFIFTKRSLPSYMHCVCDLLQYLVLDIGYMPENWVLGFWIAF